MYVCLVEYVDELNESLLLFYFVGLFIVIEMYCDRLRVIILGWTNNFCCVVKLRLFKEDGLGKLWNLSDLDFFCFIVD